MQGRIQGGWIVVLEFFSATTGQHRAIAQTQVGTIVENGHVRFAEQTGDRPKRAAESAVKKHRVFATEKFRDAAFEFSMQISHSREHRRTASAQAVCLKRFVRSRNHCGVISETKIIIGTEIDNRARLASIIDRCASVGRGKQFGFIQFYRPRSDSHPVCKTRRRLEWIAGFASEKVTQTKFCGILVHSLWQSARHGGLPYRGSHCTGPSDVRQDLYRLWHGHLAREFLATSWHEDLCREFPHRQAAFARGYGVPWDADATPYFRVVRKT